MDRFKDADPDVFCYLYAKYGAGSKGAMAAVDLPENEHRRLKKFPMLNMWYPEIGQKHVHKRHCLALRFSDIPQTRLGILVGTSQTADIRLPPLDDLDPIHVAFTFSTTTNKLLVRDMHSHNCTRFGTSKSVDEYDVTGRHISRRQDLSPLVSGWEWSVDPNDHPTVPPTILLGRKNAVGFCLVVPWFDTESEEYRKKVKIFRSPSTDISPLLAHAPDSLPLDERGNPLALSPRDSFMDVFSKPLHNSSKTRITAIRSHIKNDYVVKQCLDIEPLHVRQFENEIRVMWRFSRKSHSNIVQFRGSSFGPPRPKLRLELVQGRPICEIPYLTAIESTKILIQVLGALEFLHGLNPPVVHRALNGKHILVHRDPADENNISAKLIDLSLAATSPELSPEWYKTQWAPPEARNLYDLHTAGWSRAPDKYNVDLEKKADIWSCGITIAESICGLPSYFDCEDYFRLALSRVSSTLSDGKAGWESERLLRILQRNMLAVDPKRRLDAHHCRIEAENLLGQLTEDSTHPPDTLV